MQRGLSILRGNSLFARAMRGSAVAGSSYAASQLLRLLSNLVLTRLLLPDAFGLMALVTVFVVGLTMFSDVGIGPSVMQSPRGDDEDFLNTAWTIQAIRGAMLWLVCVGLAWPAAWFYEAPQLLTLLPVAGLTLILQGFFPTRIETAQRHLKMGRMMALDLLSQAIGIVAMVVLAFLWASVWALAIGTVIGALAKLVLTWGWLEGTRNRFRWEPAAAQELIHFGKWIFMSTICGYLVAQGDRAILGQYLTLESLGIYNIGFFLASFPILLAGAIMGRVLIPVYRDQRAEGDGGRRLRRMRLGLTGFLFALLAFLATTGVLLVGLLYSDTYRLAGGIVVLIACAQMPQLIGMSYDFAALAAGDSRGFFWLSVARAGGVTLLFLAGAEYAGLVGAIAGQAMGHLLVYPAIVRLARRHGVWHPRHDIIFASLALVASVVALLANWDAVTALAATGVR